MLPFSILLVRIHVFLKCWNQNDEIKSVILTSFHHSQQEVLRNSDPRRQTLDFSGLNSGSSSKKQIPVGSDCFLNPNTTTGGFKWKYQTGSPQSHGSRRSKPLGRCLRSILGIVFLLSPWGLSWSASHSALTAPWWSPDLRHLHTWKELRARSFKFFDNRANFHMGIIQEGQSCLHCVQPSADNGLCPFQNKDVLLISFLSPQMSLFCCLLWWITHCVMLCPLSCQTQTCGLHFFNNEVKLNVIIFNLKMRLTLAIHKNLIFYLFPAIFLCLFSCFSC